MHVKSLAFCPSKVSMWHTFPILLICIIYYQSWKELFQELDSLLVGQVYFLFYLTRVKFCQRCFANFKKQKNKFNDPEVVLIGKMAWIPTVQRGWPWPCPRKWQSAEGGAGVPGPERGQERLQYPACDLGTWPAVHGVVLQVPRRL